MTGVQWNEIVWRQLGAAIDMLENAMVQCPDAVWSGGARQPEFWYTAYHTLFFLDFYLSESAAAFAPPEPFTLSELDPSGAMPERAYTIAELLVYLQHGRSKCRALLSGLSEAAAEKRCGFERPDVSVVELLLYTLRHVQHHAAQLNLTLRQTTGSAPAWVARAAASNKK